jgi:exopolysaccharide biosynthesis polyprenyl glycosylphosphotransferase
VLPLPTYDVRIRQELALRRLLTAIARRLTGMALLHVVDAAVVGGAVVLLDKLSTLSHVESVIVPAVGMTLFALHAGGAYANDSLRSVWRIGASVVVAALGLSVLTLVPPRLDLSAGLLFALAGLSVTGLLLGRYLFMFGVRQAHKHGIGLRRAIVVGRHADAQRVVSALEGDSDADHQLLGFVAMVHTADARALGSIDEIETILDRLEPEEVILSSTLDRVQTRRVADACIRRGVAILTVPSWERAIRGWAEPVRIGPLPGFHVHPARMAMPGLALKRVTDVALTSVGLVVAAPLMGLIAIAIKLDSRGPVFYRQRRVGLGGREFMMWKFRSMQHEADAAVEEIAPLNCYPDGRLFKVECDPRITRVGRALRRFSLDELPQLFNVLAGDMSLVGPRPPVPREVKRYDRRHFIRLSVVPGMTGPWQVNGRNLIRDFEEVVRLERRYIESWSLATDFEIMLKTIGVVLSGKGAY